MKSETLILWKVQKIICYVSETYQFTNNNNNCAGFSDSMWYTVMEYGIEYD